MNTLIGPPALYARVAGEHIRETGLTCLGKSTPYISIVNKTIFTAPELHEKCAAKSQVFPSLPNIPRKDITETIFGGNFKHQFNIFHITQYFWVKSYKLNQWNLLNILAYISAIFDDFFQGGSVPLTIVINSIGYKYVVRLFLFLVCGCDYFSHQGCFSTYFLTCPRYVEVLYEVLYEIITN